MNLTPGMALWYVEDGGRARSVTVETVGRKWATLVECPRERVEVATGDVCERGYGRRGQVWLTRLAHEEDRYLRARWRDLAREVSGPMPKGMTLETINNARRLLKLEVPNE